MNYKIVSSETSIISLSEAKAYLKANDDDDSIISDCINAAIEFCEEKTKRAIQLRIYDYFIDSLPTEVVLPKPPLVSVESIKLRCKTNQTITVNTSDYYVDADSEPGKIFVNDIPSYEPVPSNSVVIRYKAGYTRNEMPMTIYQAILLLASHWYDNRGIISIGNVSKELDFSVSALLSTHKIYGW